MGLFTKVKDNTNGESTRRPTKPTTSNSDGIAKVCDTVYFKGGYHYNTSNASKRANLLARRASNARITYIAKGTKYPYHLVHTGKGNVCGWVAEKDIEFGKPNATIKPSASFDIRDKAKSENNVE